MEAEDMRFIGVDGCGARGNRNQEDLSIRNVYLFLSANFSPRSIHQPRIRAMAVRIPVSKTAASVWVSGIATFLRDLSAVSWRVTESM